LIQCEKEGFLLTKRLSLRVLFIAVFASMLGLGIVVPLLPYYADTLGAIGIGIGLIFSGFALSRAVFMPLSVDIQIGKGGNISSSSDLDSSPSSLLPISSPPRLPG
jgi:hypothetical protein